MPLPSSSPPCLDEETVARLIDGRISGILLARAEEHLSTCEDCLRLVADVDALRSCVRAGGGGAADERDGPLSPAPLAFGSRVGRYVILAPIGAGGMGRVYAARDPALDRRVAVKVLHRRATGPELEARLLREAKAMARLAHDAVITVHDVGRFGEQLFVAMELVEGGTLRQWLAAKERPWREVLAVFLRAGRGLARAHASGIVHRDFKPDNVLVGDDGRVRVTDFGLALTAQARAKAPSPPGADVTADLDASGPLTRRGAVVGTPAYMAPELLRGASADARSDVYGFAIALWEGLHGERPFRGATFAALQTEKLAGVPAPARARRSVPPALRRVLLAALRPDPDARYQSMDALLTALERAARPRRLAAIAAVTVAAFVSAAAALAVELPPHAAIAQAAASAPRAVWVGGGSDASVHVAGDRPHTLRRRRR